MSKHKEVNIENAEFFFFALGWIRMDKLSIKPNESNPSFSCDVDISETENQATHPFITKKKEFHILTEFSFFYWLFLNNEISV
jgi:hypothetical protein